MTHVVKKCNSGLSALRSFRGSLPKKALLAICRSLIESHLRYGISVWGNCGILYTQDYKRYRIGQHELLLVQMNEHHQ